MVNLLQALLTGEPAPEHSGAAALRAEFTAIRAAFPDATLAIVHQIAEGDLVGTHATISGTHTGPLHGIAPTGRPVEWSLLILNRVSEGRVIEHRGNVGWMDVLGKIGVLPPAPGSE